MRKTILMFTFLCWILTLPAQQVFQLQGKVIDDTTEEEMIGVSIVEKGTNNGTITDLEGNFSLTLQNGTTLVISYVGYKTQEIVVNNAGPLVIRLATDTQLIDELVVVGYTVQKRRDVLGAVSKVDNAELNKIPVSSAQAALQGRVAGVNVSSQTGAPGSSVSVRIRGVGSVNSSNEPLYIVDGIQMENALANISPQDIENISVLKDASYAAIYGSRATNGVVLITTKNGKPGESKITYNGQIGFQRRIGVTDMVNTNQYIELYNEAATADNLTAAVPRPLIEGNYLREFANVNHLEEIFRTAPIQTHELSFSGGSEKTQYLLSLSYYNQQGIIKNSGYERINVRSNIKSDVKNWLQVGLNANIATSNQKRVSASGDGFAGEGGSVIRYAYFRNPAIPVKNQNGEYIDRPSEYFGNAVYDSFFGDGYNPVGLAENTDMTDKTRSVLLSGNVLVKLPYNFSLKSVVGIDYNNFIARTFNKTWGTGGRINSLNSLSVSDRKLSSMTANATLNHNFDIGENHAFNWFVGTEAVKVDDTVLGGSESGLSDLIYLGNGTSMKEPYQGEYGSSLLSFFGTLNYNYKQKYYVSLLLREDGSSKFVGKNKWGTFYSVSGGWNIESEDFMRSFTTIDKLKLRVGYGSIGNQNVNTYYPTLDIYNSGYYYPFGGNAGNGWKLTNLGNQDLKWETNNQFNAGIDLELWRSSFGISLDYFYKVTHDMIVEASLPPSIGNALPPYINNGSVLNTGIDIELFYRKNYTNGGFNITFNGGFLKNEVLSIVPQIGGMVDTGVYATRTEVGHPIGSFYLYEMDGIFQNELEVLTSAYQGRDIQPGDVKYKDNFEDNVIDSKDRVHVGSAIPKFTTGLNLSGNYKGWDLALFFQGAFGHRIYRQIAHDSEGFYRGFGVTQRYYNERWTGEGTSNTQPRASWSAKQNNARAGSTRFLEDGSYFRLKNIQLGYTIPNTKRIHIDNIRLYLAASNILTFTKYPGLDPEMTVSTNSAAEGDKANGIDWGTYPVAMSFTFGLNVTF